MPSYKRATEVEHYGERAEANTMVEDMEEDGWVAPPAVREAEGDAEEIPSGQPSVHAGAAAAEAEVEAEDIPDIDDLELEDEAGEQDEVRAFHLALLLWCQGICWLVLTTKSSRF